MVKMVEMHVGTDHGSWRRQRQLVSRARARVAVRRKKRHKSLAGTRRWISPGLSMRKGHNQISPRHARGGDSAVAHTFKAFLFVKRVGPGRGLLWGSPWTHPVYEYMGCDTPSECHPVIRISSQPPDNCAWRDVSRWHDVDTQLMLQQENYFFFLLQIEINNESWFIIKII